MPEIAESIDELPDGIHSFSVNKPDELIISSKTTTTKLAPRVKNRFYVENKTTIKIISTTKKPTTKARSTPRPTTRKNFRKNNDYYAMYYD